MKNITSKTIVFVTGAFVTHLRWTPSQECLRVARVTTRGGRTFVEPDSINNVTTP